MCVVMAMSAACPDRVVDLLDVAQVHVLGVLAAPGDLGALGRVVQVGQRGVVELQVGAAQLAQPLHLVGVRAAARSAQNSSMSGYTDWSTEAGPPR
jgi:hypothetical protein